MTRDPRINPQAGDVLTKRAKGGRGIRRTVDRVEFKGNSGFDVYYNGRTSGTWYLTWRKWARHARVASPRAARPEWARQPTPSMELVAVASCIEGWASNLSMGVSDSKEAAEKIQECCAKLNELTDHLGEAKWKT